MLAEVPRQVKTTTKPRPNEPFEISWSLASPTVESLIGEALRCEERGLDGIWFPDHEAPRPKWPELYVTLSAIATQTRSVRLGSMVTDVLRRHPVVTAHAFASLSHMAPGRVILGLGAGGGPSQSPFGVSLDHSVGRLDEGIRVIRALWGAEKERADFSGRYFALKGAQPPLFPQTEIPVYVASYGPRMLSLTAQLADGWLPESHTPETYRKTLLSIHARMKKFGRNPRSLHACCASIFYPWNPDERAFSRLLRAAKRYLADAPDIQWAAGVGEDHPRLRAHEVEKDPELLERLMSRVPDRLAEATLVYGERTQCYEKLSRMREAGCMEAILEPYWIEKERLTEGIDVAGQIRSLLLRENP